MTSLEMGKASGLLAALLLFAASAFADDNAKIHRAAEQVARDEKRLQKSIDKFQAAVKPKQNECLAAKGSFHVDGFTNLICEPPKPPVANPADPPQN